MPNGVVSYTVTLSGINLVNNSTIDITSNTATLMETMYTIEHSSVPYSDYTAVVVAMTSAGPGPESTLTVQTSEAGMLYTMPTVIAFFVSYVYICTSDTLSGNYLLSCFRTLCC